MVGERGILVHQQDNFLTYKFNFKIILKFRVNFLENWKKHKLENGRENLYEFLDKLYFRLDRILNKICEILEQILKRLEFL